jgi:hypothetical protein
MPIEILAERSLMGDTVRIEAGWMLRPNMWTQSGLAEISQNRLAARASEDDGPESGFQSKERGALCILVRSNLNWDNDTECPGACAGWC